MARAIRLLLPGNGATQSAFQKWRWIITAWLVLLLPPAIGMGAWAAGLQLSGNIHVVEPAQLYRAAQLNGPSLEKVLTTYAIRTVINLRGENDGASWYDDEVAVVRKRGLVHIDIRMSANLEPDQATISNLVHALREAPRPILVHCQSGSDRSGLAAALYELLVAQRPASEAAGQLSFRYGHFPWLWSHTSAMDDTFAHIAATASQHSQGK